MSGPSLAPMGKDVGELVRSAAVASVNQSVLHSPVTMYGEIRRG